MYKYFKNIDEPIELIMKKVAPESFTPPRKSMFNDMDLSDSMVSLGKRNMPDSGLRSEESPPRSPQSELPVAICQTREHSCFEYASWQTINLKQFKEITKEIFIQNLIGSDEQYSETILQMLRSLLIGKFGVTSESCPCGQDSIKNLLSDEYIRGKVCMKADDSRAELRRTECYDVLVEAFINEEFRRHKNDKPGTSEDKIDILLELFAKSIHSDCARLKVVCIVLNPQNEQDSALFKLNGFSEHDLAGKSKTSYSESLDLIRADPDLLRRFENYLKNCMKDPLIGSIKRTVASSIKDFIGKMNLILAQRQCDSEEACLEAFRNEVEEPRLRLPKLVTELNYCASYLLQILNPNY